MNAILLRRIKEAYGRGVIEGMIWQVPEPVPPSEHRVKYRLVYVVDGRRMVGYDNERGKGDHKHIRGTEMAYRFKDVKTLIGDFMRDVKEMES
jgi:hypothetical protein